jgi:hypothetical protein
MTANVLRGFIDQSVQLLLWEVSNARSRLVDAIKQSSPGFVSHTAGRSFMRRKRLHADGLVFLKRSTE